MTLVLDPALPDAVVQAEALAHQLEQMLEKEFEFLKSQNLDAFDAAQAAKNELLQELSRLTGVNDPNSADQLGTEWDAFRQRVAHCRDLHRRNEVLIGRKIEAIRGALQSLQLEDATSSVEIYDRLGRLSRHRRSGGRGYSDA